jgi:hypothetical protein
MVRERGKDVLVDLALAMESAAGQGQSWSDNAE